MENNYIFLSDDKIFYTIEGEGEYVGLPSVFMRLSMCNLSCKGFASSDSPNGCDSFISWSVKNRMTFEDIIKYIESNDYHTALKAGAIWKITGGEPLIQQNKLIELVRAFAKYFGFIPHIDFETNATILPAPEWKNVYNATFTTSPKLSNNGDPVEKRYKPEVLKWHANNKSGFKFVVSGEDEVREILEKYVYECNVPTDRIWLMPCCGSRSEHIERAMVVAELCKKYYFKFSPRLQLIIWDKALKV
jgi:organic radical activating enzyme